MQKKLLLLCLLRRGRREWTTGSGEPVGSTSCHHSCPTKVSLNNVGPTDSKESQEEESRREEGGDANRGGAAPESARERNSFPSYIKFCKQVHVAIIAGCEWFMVNSDPAAERKTWYERIMYRVIYGYGILVTYIFALPGHLCTKIGIMTW